MNQQEFVTKMEALVKEDPNKNWSYRFLGSSVQVVAETNKMACICLGKMGQIGTHNSRIGCVVHVFFD